MTHGDDSASPMWSIPGYGHSIPVMDPTGSGITWADQTGGLTKRELFAAMAMQGIAADPNCFNAKTCAKNAVEWADALIAELSKPTTTNETSKT